MKDNLKISKTNPDDYEGDFNWKDFEMYKLKNPTKEICLTYLDNDGNELWREYFGNNLRIEKNGK
jgi:hypothetical protein